jgi:hypothetical protein
MINILITADIIISLMVLVGIIYSLQNKQNRIDFLESELLIKSKLIECLQDEYTKLETKDK